MAQGLKVRPVLLPSFSSASSSCAWTTCSSAAPASCLTEAAPAGDMSVLGSATGALDDATVGPSGRGRVWSANCIIQAHNNRKTIKDVKRWSRGLTGSRVCCESQTHNHMHVGPPPFCHAHVPTQHDLHPPMHSCICPCTSQNASAVR